MTKAPHPVQGTASSKTPSSKALSIFYLSFFAAFGNPLIMPLLPSIMAEYSLSAMEMSLMISMFALPGVCVIPLFGFLEDRVGRRPLLLGSLLLCTLSSAMCAFADSYAWLVFGRAMQGLAVTPLEALTTTLISDTFQGEERMRYIGINTSILYLGVAVFPIMSTGVLLLLGWRAAFMLPVIMCLPLLFVAVTMTMPYHPSPNVSLKHYFSDIKRLLTSRTLLSLFLVRTLVAFVMFGVVYTHLPQIIVDKAGASPNLVGIMFSVASAAMATACLTISRITRLIPRPLAGFYAGLLLVLGMTCLLLAQSLGLVFVALAAYGFGIGAITTITTAAVAGTATPDTRATVLALHSTLFRAAQTIGPFVFGFAFATGGFDLLFGCAIVGAFILAFTARYAFGLAKKGNVIPLETPPVA